MEQADYLSKLKNMTANYAAYRGWMAIPGGLVLLIVGLKLLFAPFDNTVAGNPSLFDITGNVWWDLASAFSSVLFVFVIVAQFWYNKNVGRVKLSLDEKNKRIAMSMVFAILFLTGFMLDYNMYFSFSASGILFSGIWLSIYFTQPDFKKLYLLFVAIQLITFVAGPFIFAGLQDDLLNYMRHVVGLVYVTTALLVIISGFVTHNFLMNNLKAGIEKEA